MVNISPISGQTLEIAAEALRRGDLVAFPTETVYGLGADATNDRAVARIFEAKGRPHFNPLIVHFPDRAAAGEFVDFNAAADALAARFWPGALTLVLPRRRDCGLSLLVSAGLDTVAVRVPAHADARRLLKAAGVPVAAPSANRSGRLSPTTARHVAEDLGDRVALILDGGPCAIGLESTVLDLSGAPSGRPPAILRQGGLTQEDIEAALGQPVIVAGTDDEAPRSPGMLTSHYAPSLPVRPDATKPRPGEAMLGFGPGYEDAVLNLSAGGDLIEAAANLFAYLHELDKPAYSGIAIAPIPKKGLGRAINDRLRRAAAGR
jgi:L-threonylcarbamoyladenylate synthase